MKKVARTELELGIRPVPEQQSAKAPAVRYRFYGIAVANPSTTTRPMAGRAFAYIRCAVTFDNMPKVRGGLAAPSFSISTPAAPHCTTVPAAAYLNL